MSGGRLEALQLMAEAHWRDFGVVGVFGMLRVFGAFLGFWGVSGFRVLGIFGPLLGISGFRFFFFLGICGFRGLGFRGF